MDSNIDKFLKLLDISNDDSLVIKDIESIDDDTFIHIIRKPLPTYCSICNAKMNSKGIYKRIVKHPVLQTYSNLHIVVHQRRWKCKKCGQEVNESFPFVDRYSQTTNITPLLILKEMKNLNNSTAEVARRFNVSDSHVHNVFTAYIDLKRLPLTEYISIDEVYLNINGNQKYAFIIMDFVSGEIIDILHNRWQSTLEEYFYSIPREERLKVKCVISDAYNTYLTLSGTIFPNAKPILDSFRVIKYLIYLLNNYMNKEFYKYKKINEKEKFKKSNI